MTKLRHRCVGCGRIYENGRTLHCQACDGLLRAEYSQASFRPTDGNGLFAFLDWLPPSQGIETSMGPCVYASERLADHLGLEDLWIGFNGYAPEVGAHNPTGSFKDFEALPTLLYLREQGHRSVILASAGNTARAFAHAAGSVDMRVLLVIPEVALDRLWLPMEKPDSVHMVVVESSSDYAAAIRLAALISERLDVTPEGGARNVARRDGMGTAVLEYARVRRDLPRHYVQAIGSGTGGIAAWEAGLRLLSAGVGQRLPRLHLVQNLPFAPIHAAWTHGSPIRGDEDLEIQQQEIQQIAAQVLANRNPPYALPGGVRDALHETGGATHAATNDEAHAAQDLFLRTEGIPIGPAAGVALAGLQHAIARREIAKDESVLLHITGNNDVLLRRDMTLHPMAPDVRVSVDQINARGVDRLRDSLLG